ncbi:PspC domain-containing protein [Flammeovirgaceae bacterium SG7u.111]|nr:PspC domain-containing protein [Flammeovirgaceae bacterium SG7u.132]WPO35557.1 PspC domain-containing protein [Flammeovirgaceae bacterium SG7u.111]
MKKNISINIGGIIFHIEEDGYENLSEYLSEINSYFANYEDSSEIIADIENRIAEIFLSKLNENKQIITVEDVDLLIETMGRVTDFEAAEATSDQSYSTGYSSAESGYYSAASEPKSGKKLFRDEKRRLIGGVCSGMAHYLKIDPLWIRLVFMLSVFDFLFDFTITGFFVLAYILLWIVIPGSWSLEEDENMRRLFRDEDRKVIGGVASGVAAYFGIDKTIVRVIFVASTFTGGIGLVTYLIIWFITPEARSITEKMQMKGEPITLSNIESKIKDSLHFGDDEEDENILVKILLFPFRLISKLLDGAGPNLKPFGRFLFRFLSVLAGIFLFIVSLAVTVALLGVLGVFFGVINNFDQIAQNAEIPISIIQNSLPPLGLVFGFMAAWVPFIFVGILGLSLIASRIITAPLVNWGLLGLWIIGLIGAGVTLPIFFTEFQASGTEKQVKVFDVPEERLELSINENAKDEFSNVKLTIRGHERNEIELVQWHESRGKTRQQAIQNAKKAVYDFEPSNQNLVFNTHFTLKEDAPYRMQEVKLRLFLPYKKEFTMDYQLKDILLNTLHPNNFSVSDLRENHVWFFDENGLNCVDCASAKVEQQQENFGSVSSTNEYDDFDNIRISGAFEVQLTQGNTRTVSIMTNKSQYDDLEIINENRELWIKKSEQSSSEKPEAIVIAITTPRFENLKLEGAIKANLKGFETKETRINLLGAVELYAEIDAKMLELEATGASKATLKGVGESLSLKILGASVVEAYDFKAKRVKVDALGVSNAQVFASQKLNINTSFGSSVDYKGNPDQILEGEIKEEE